MGSYLQILAPDNLVKGDDELEEVFWTSRPKQRHVDRHRLDVPLSRLGFDIDLKRIQLVRRGLAEGWVGFLGDRRRRAPILPKLFW